VLRQGEEFLLDTEEATAATVFRLVGRFVLAGDFRVADESQDTVHFAVAGHDAARIVGATLGPQAACVTHGHSCTLNRQGRAVTVMRFQHTGTDGFDCITDAEHGPALWDALQTAGARPVGVKTLETLRIEAGLPRYGVDVDDTTVVLETGQDVAVSFTKGCYTGQEIIARIHWRGHVAKRLAGLKFAAGRAEVAPGDEITTPDGAPAGRLTSVTYSPALGCTVALGYVRYAHLAPDTELRVGPAAARVAELPFVKSEI
jgi:folate-binding protein YgfZ